MSSWKYARVELDMMASEMVAARIVGWAAMSLPDKGPGLSQNDAVQFAARLAILRHYASCGASAFQWAIFDADGTFRRTVWAGRAVPELETGESALPIFGDQRSHTPGPGGAGLPADWGRELMLAIDQVLHQLKKAEQAGTVPAGYGEPGTVPPPGVIEAGLGAGIVAILVGGAAVAIVAAVAVWRYLDPEVRTQAAAVATAARAYQLRLEHAVTTGTLLPPSALETANAEAVAAAAKKARERGWMYGGLAVGGIGAGVGLSSLVRSKVA